MGIPSQSALVYNLSWHQENTIADKQNGVTCKLSSTVAFAAVIVTKSRITA